MSEALTFADVERVVQAMAGVGVFPRAAHFLNREY